MQGFYTEERFISAEFTAGLRSAIAKAITLSGLYERQADLDIRLIVALPHAVRTKYASTVIGLAAGEHSYYMTFNADAEKRFHFTIEESNIYTVSQIIAAILGETSDDRGYINQKNTITSAMARPWLLMASTTPPALYLSQGAVVSMTSMLKAMFSTP